MPTTEFDLDPSAFEKIRALDLHPKNVDLEMGIPVQAELSG